MDRKNPGPLRNKGQKQEESLREVWRHKAGEEWGGGQVLVLPGVGTALLGMTRYSPSVSSCFFERKIQRTTKAGDGLDI